MTAQITRHPPRNLAEEPEPMKERPRQQQSLLLAALPSAVSSARSFVTLTLLRWHAPLAIDAAVFLIEEMVSSAVRTVGVSDPAVEWTRLDHLELIEIHLLDLRGGIGIEVCDSATYESDQPATPATADLALLEVFQATAGQWGISPAHRGRVVWVELPVYERAESGLPIRPRTPSPIPRQAAVPAKIPGEDLLCRVRDGLDKL